MSILAAQNLSASYNGNTVLRNVSFSVNQGEFIAIAGPNGAGKSTLLRLLAGLLKPLDGEVTLLNKPLSSFSRRSLAQKMAVIFQNLSFPYDFTVFDIVSLGRSPFVRRWRPLSSQDFSAITDAMKVTNTYQLRERSFQQLSAGERQRVILAKAFAQQPTILLLDEPATHLDIHHQVNIFNILSQLNQQDHLTILCITHDLTLAAQYTDRFLFLADGQIVADGHSADVIQKPMIEAIFQTKVYIGNIPQANRPFIYPLRHIDIL